MKRDLTIFALVAAAAFAVGILAGCSSKPQTDWEARSYALEAQRAEAEEDYRRQMLRHQRRQSWALEDAANAAKFGY